MIHHTGNLDPPAVAAEAWFYAYAHGYPKDRLIFLKRLKEVLLGGARSPGWDFSPNINQARTDNHPNLQWLERIATAISGRAGIKILDEWDDWKQI